MRDLFSTSNIQSWMYEYISFNVGLATCGLKQLKFITAHHQLGVYSNGKMGCNAGTANLFLPSTHVTVSFNETISYDGTMTSSKKYKVVLYSYSRPFYFLYQNVWHSGVYIPL